MTVSTADEVLRSFSDRWGASQSRRVKLQAVAWSSGAALVVLCWLFVHQNSGASAAKGPSLEARSIETSTAGFIDEGENNVAVEKKETPRLLIALLTPVTLFTGVLACGLICLLNLWMDRRYLPRELRMPLWLVLLNVVATGLFLVLGLKGYWDFHDPNGPVFSRLWFAIGGLIMAALVAIGIAHWMKSGQQKDARATILRNALHE